MPAGLGLRATAQNPPKPLGKKEASLQSLTCQETSENTLIVTFTGRGGAGLRKVP